MELRCLYYNKVDVLDLINYYMINPIFTYFQSTIVQYTAKISMFKPLSFIIETELLHLKQELNLCTYWNLLSASEGQVTLTGCK